MARCKNYQSVLIGQKCLHKKEIKTCVDVFRNKQRMKYVKLMDNRGVIEPLCARHFYRCRKRLRNSEPMVKYEETLRLLNVIF